MYYSQRDPQWNNKPMGGGIYSIGLYGCYLTSLANGLNLRLGKSTTPAFWNDFLAFLGLNSAGKWKNYMEEGEFATAMPTLFAGFEKIEPYPQKDGKDDNQKLFDLVNDKNKIVIGRVNAKAIGGAGDHFVLVIGYDKKVAMIHDPWTNTQELVTKKYSRYDNLLGFRVFSIKR